MYVPDEIPAPVSKSPFASEPLVTLDTVSVVPEIDPVTTALGADPSKLAVIVAHNCSRGRTPNA